MKSELLHTVSAELIQARLDRRKFFRQAGLFGLGAAASGLIADSAVAQKPVNPVVTDQERDTVTEIFTAALIAEDLASTFYYNGLVGPVIQDPNLAGPGGSATNVTTGDFGNVNYIRAALSEEITHANLLRSLLGISGPAADPVQTFYFPVGSFDTLAAFIGLLEVLENAFIGAYLTAVQEFAIKASNIAIIQQFYPKDPDAKYTATQLAYFAKVSASIMGIECEHRVLGRDIANLIPANNINYEETDGLTAVFNGATSAVAALTPFLTPSTGPAFSLAVALANQSTVSTPTVGGPPAS